MNWGFCNENHYANISHLENITREITWSTYLTSIGTFISSCSDLDNDTLLIINGYVLGIIWGKNCFFLFYLLNGSCESVDDPINAHGAAAYAGNLIPEIYRIIGNGKAIMGAVHTVWNVSKYGVFCDPYFPAFGLNTDRYEVFLKTPYLDTFYSVPK